MLIRFLPGHHPGCLRYLSRHRMVAIGLDGDASSMVSGAGGWMRCANPSGPLQCLRL